MNWRGVYKRDVFIGVGAALGLGLVLLVLALVLTRPSGAPTTPPAVLSTATTVPTAIVASSVQEPLPMLSATSTVALTPESVAPGPSVITYTVQPGDTLWDIAVRFKTSVEALAMANAIVGETIWPGDVLTVATDGAWAPISVVSPTVIAGDPPATPPAEGWNPSIVEGNLAAAYPTSLRTERFTLHTTPGTYADLNADATAAMVARGLAHIEQTFRKPLAGTFDVYAAGSIFATPNHDLRGFSVSAARRYFFLHDGTGTAEDQLYIVTHELTHLYAWNTFGRPVSAMLSEGAAVAAGLSAIADGDHLPLKIFCAAYELESKLPRVSGNLSFRGHIRDLQNYYAAGCFVQYLWDTYGLEKFEQLYPAGNYNAVYGKSLTALETDWRVDLATYHDEVSFASATLVQAVDAVAGAYEELFRRFTGTPAEMRAYRALDAGRIALVEGRFEDVDVSLAAFRAALNS